MKKFAFLLLFHRCRADAIFSTSDFDLRDAGIFEELQLTQMAMFFLQRRLPSLTPKEESSSTPKFSLGREGYAESKAHGATGPDTGKKSGEFLIGNDLEVTRLGLGAMRLTGEGIWGEPKNRAEAVRVLRRAVELGINFIDTADSYGPHVSEEIIAEALHPYPVGLVIATKGGFGSARSQPMGRSPDRNTEIRH